MHEKPLLFEVFTDSDEESEAVRVIRNLEISVKGAAKQAVRAVFGDAGVAVAKRIIGG